MARILLIDDDEGGRKMAAYNLLRAGYEIDEAPSGQAGLAAFRPESHDLVITDVRMPGISGIEVTQELRKRARDVPILVVTAYGNVETAVQAMKAGAFDFVLKPFSRDQLLLTVKKALERQALERENRKLKRELKGIERPITFCSTLMAETLRMVDRVAQSNASALITGESGTGKELVARRIHSRSSRSEGPFVAVNCAAIPGELIEDELFGHEKGAFTGAAQARSGRFRQANGGSLFLDEIAELPLATQGKLLRVLQESEVDVLGLDRPVSVDVRVVAATNKDLRAEVASGHFREDLFFRLNVVELHIPPLRQRPEDIPELVKVFVSELANGRDMIIPEKVMAALHAREWVGNVRELRNACERLVILCPANTLRLEDLPVDRADFARGVDSEQMSDSIPLPAEGFSLLDLEKSVIERVLSVKGGNIAETARYLQIPRHVLVYRIEKYGIRRPQKGASG